MNNISNVLLKTKAKAMAKLQCGAYAAGEKIVSKLDKEALDETMRTIASVTAAMGVSAMIPTMAGASKTAKVDKVMKNFSTIITDIGAAIGAVLLALGLIRFAMKLKDNDQQGLHSAVYTFAAGGVLLMGNTIVKFIAP